MKVYVLIDASGEDIDDFIVGVYGDKKSAKKAIRDHMYNHYNMFDEEELLEVVEAIMHNDYENIFCEEREVQSI